MIVYRAESLPIWLEGAQELCERLGDGCTYYAIGDPVLLSPPADGWVQVADGIDAAAIGAPLSHPIVREIPGMRMDVARNASGGTMACPVVLTQDGARAFVAPIGDDYLPALTHEQERMLSVANAARDALTAAAETDEGALDSAAAGRWSVELLCYANHINPGTLIGLGLLDEAMVVDALTTACCRG